MALYEGHIHRHFDGLQNPLKWLYSAIYDILCISINRGNV